MASKNFGFCVPHSRTALVNVKSRKSSAVMQCSAADEMGALSAIVAVIDRYAFWCSVFVGIAGWVYIDSRRVPAAFTRECGTQLRRFFLLCSAATGALIASVISDGVLTSFRLVGTRWSLDSLIPIVSMAIEVVCAGGLVVSIRGMTKRTASTGRRSTRCHHGTPAGPSGRTLGW